MNERLIFFFLFVYFKMEETSTRRKTRTNTRWNIFGRVGSVVKSAIRAINTHREHVITAGVFFSAITIFITAQRRYIASLPSSSSSTYRALH